MCLTKTMLNHFHKVVKMIMINDKDDLNFFHAINNGYEGYMLTYYEKQG